MAKRIKPTMDEWKALYDAAGEFKRTECWKWMQDEEVFGVQDPETGEIGYCCIMGNLGENLGLAAYLGAEGLEGYYKILSGEIQPDDPDLMFSQKCLMASFENREYLAPDDLKIIKELGMKFRGKNAWPLFRNYTPGFFPWFVNAAECRFLTHILQQAVVVAMLFKEGKVFLNAGHAGKFFVRVPLKNEKGPLLWKNEYLEPSPYQKGYIVFDIRDEVRIKRIINAVKKKVQAWEVDTFFAPSPIKEKGRPFYPKACAFVDHESGLVLSIEIVRDIEEEGYIFLETLLGIIERTGQMPRNILVVREEAFYLFKDLAERLGIEMIMVDELENIAELRYGMMDFMKRQ